MTSIGPMVETHNLAVQYGSRQKSHALEPTSISIDTGQWVALLGPNGSGKSTLLKCLSTLSKPTQGTLNLFGESPFKNAKATAAARARLGVVFQNGALDALLTVRENLLLVAACFSLDRASERVDAIVETLGITDRMTHRVGTLSGGLMRRVDLARALLPEPSLLLLDEPTTGLDLESRQRFIGSLQSIRQQRSMTIVFATHQMDEAEAADRVIMMADGTMIADDTPGHFREHAGRTRLTLESTLPEDLRQTLDLPETDASIPVDASNLQTLSTLASNGIAFRVGPPSLGDIYLEKTGQRLVDQP